MGRDEKSMNARAGKRIPGNLVRPAPDGVGVTAARAAGLPELLAKIDAGYFGTTSANLLILDSLAAALDRGVEAYTRLTERTAAPASEAELTLKPLTEEERRLAGYFFLHVFCYFAGAAMGEIGETPEVEGALSEDGMDALAEMDEAALAHRLARLLTEFLRRERQAPTAEPMRTGAQAATAIHVFVILLRRVTDALVSRGRLGRMKQLLDTERFQIGDTEWKGFVPRVAAQDKGTLLRPVTAADIVGNRDYLDAGMRLARDTAGYDFEAKKNPKQINPILFGLGRPGCGKTLVAHAVGNAFLTYCSERNVPSKFVVIRKSDWASSYQNASAANLIRIFKELYQFDGVTGVYWADIDTALASRDQAGLRSEEKADLSAAFNIFDGTLIPFDGKWFMICDANNLQMDEALRTRIAKNPFRVKGPETPLDYIRLLRDILLPDFRPHLVLDENAWMSVGEAAVRGDISGRGIEGISRQIIDRVQDFEYPDEYYRTDYEGRAAMIQKLSKKVEGPAVLGLVERYIAFEKEEEERLATQRFDDAVKDVVFELNVRREVARRLPEDKG